MFKVRQFQESLGLKSQLSRHNKQNHILEKADNNKSPNITKTDIMFSGYETNIENKLNIFPEIDEHHAIVILVSFIVKLTLVILQNWILVRIFAE